MNLVYILTVEQKPPLNITAELLSLVIALMTTLAISLRFYVKQEITVNIQDLKLSILETQIQAKDEVLQLINTLEAQLENNLKTLEDVIEELKLKTIESEKELLNRIVRVLEYVKEGAKKTGTRLDMLENQEYHSQHNYDRVNVLKQGLRDLGIDL